MCVCVCEEQRHDNKYAVFPAVSGGVSGGQGDGFALVGSAWMESTSTPLGPSALDS